MKNALVKSLGSFVSLSSALAMAQTIYIKPGQCIQLGSQQVCAQMNDTYPAVVNDPNPIIETLFSCRLGEYKDSEFPEFKTHALFKIHVFKDGKRLETQLQNFGLHGKDACEKERKSAEKAEEKKSKSTK
jgi:hypothetical protein